MKMTKEELQDIPCLVYKTNEAAQIMGVSTTTVYRLIREKNLPHIRLGKLYRIPKSRFYEWLERNPKYKRNQEGEKCNEEKEQL